MQVLLPNDTPTVTLSLPSHLPVNQSLNSCDLQRLGERLQVAYGPVEDTLPARLTELVERLARREPPKD